MKNATRKRTTPQACKKSVSVHVICWDGREYDKTASRAEIDDMKLDGNYRYENNQHIFDFRH